MACSVFSFLQEIRKLLSGFFFISVTGIGHADSLSQLCLLCCHNSKSDTMAGRVQFDNAGVKLQNVLFHAKITRTLMNFIVVKHKCWHFLGLIDFMFLMSVSTTDVI
jgi:hypothetical protein